MPLKPIADRILENDVPGQPQYRERRRGASGRSGFLVGILSALVLAAGGAAATYFLVGERALAILAADGAASAEKAATPPRNVFDEHALRAGVEQCRELFAQMGESLAAGSIYAAMSNWNDARPDEHAVWSMVGMRFTSGDDAFRAGGLLFAAPTGNGCEASLARVVPSPLDCGQMRDRLPADRRLLTTLEGSEVYGLATGGAVLLVPAATGCVAVTVATGTR